MLDIYTKRPIVTATQEHIVPNALGGRWAVSELIDRKTNSTFGDGIDAALASDLLLPRVMLNAKSGDGRPPPPFKGGTTAEGVPYTLLPGGKPEWGKPCPSGEPRPDSCVSAG